MLLQSIEMTDFLSIKGTVKIDVDAKVTILLGSNDHGKSNILRAIQHLNQDALITADEVNWDATGAPGIDYVFLLGEQERRGWAELIAGLRASLAPTPPPMTESTEKDAEVQPQEQADKTGAKGPSLEKPDEEKKKDEEPLARILSKLDPEAKAVVVSRKGVGASLDLGGVQFSDLPAEVLNFIKSKIPRVELFKAIGGNLQDSVGEKEIGSEEFEFLQGVFFYAGLDPRKSGPLFVQDDQTMRELDIASEKLDKSLRSLWGQGTDLHFELRHQGSTIQFLANDPAISKRKARMSKRSDGVTQFFRVSMTLHSRRMKNPANSYIYLFDEPGVFLHPQGQKDLLQVFEQLSDQSQIIFATHSLFMLNQNSPERHRLIYKNATGTKVDQKPYRANWRLATDSLGVFLTSNILFSSKVLLVEGDSDPLYIYELFRQVNKLAQLDADSNALGIMSFSDVRNLRLLLQVFKREGQDTQVLLLVDGDQQGKSTVDKIKPLCDRLKVPIHELGKAKSIEDYCGFKEKFLEAAVKTVRDAFENDGKPSPDGLDERIKSSWEEQKKSTDKTTGRWFKDMSIDVFRDEVSKVWLARNYVFLCRDLDDAELKKGATLEARKLCEEIATRLALPGIKSKQLLESR